MYFYVNIRGDLKYSQSVPIGVITRVLDASSELQILDERHYENVAAFPWLRVAIINCDDKGNYPVGLDQTVGEANLVELTFSEQSALYGERQVMALANRIATGLGWELARCDAEDEN